MKIDPPLLNDKDTDQPSVFQPETLIREARRQKGLRPVPMPTFCVLDPDGDIVRHLRNSGEARRSADWPCYHSDLYVFNLNGRDIGIVGCAVGAPYAVLVAEQLFATGCEYLLSITSAGQINSADPTPYFVIIERALRDEGTSFHYCPPAEYSEAHPSLVGRAVEVLRGAGISFHTGSTWTTDAPFRETAQAIEAARRRGILAVEMEAAALYAFANARERQVLCLAHVTNQMGQGGDDFEKGESYGAAEALRVIDAIAAAHTV